MLVKIECVTGLDMKEPQFRSSLQASQTMTISYGVSKILQLCRDIKL